uniref:transposase n=1 Tax=Polaribacter sp. TaxID=1920175 RepID=UPI003F6C0CCC
NDEIVPFKKVFLDYRTKTKKKEYRISSLTCRDCPLAKSCLGKTAKEKKFSVTYYREEYERNITRLSTPKGKAMKSKRQSTVEPVFGTLTQFMGMRKINTLGIQQANKVMHLSAMAYNLKKYLKFVTKNAKRKAKALAFVFMHKKLYSKLILVVVSLFKFRKIAIVKI